MQVLIRLFFVLCCMLPILSFSADIDSLVLEKIKAKIERKIDLQIAQNQANDRLGQGHLNNYVIDCGRLLQDADETDYFKIKEANNGKTLWSLGSAAFEEEGRGIKAILNSLNISRSDTDKIYLVLISIYDYNRDVIAWDKYKNSKDNGKIENYQAVDQLADMDWSTANDKIRTKQPLSEEEVKDLSQQLSESQKKNNINGGFVGAIIRQKIGIGKGFSPKTIACFSNYQIQFDSTQRPIYKIYNSIYRYSSHIPRGLLQLIDDATKAYDLQGAGRNEALREIVSILAQYEKCYAKDDAQYIAEVNRISVFLDNEIKKLPSGVKSGVFVTEQSSVDFIGVWTVVKAGLNQLSPFNLISSPDNTINTFSEMHWRIRQLEEKTGYRICVVVDNSTINICDDLIAESVFLHSKELDKTNTILVYARLVGTKLSTQEMMKTIYIAHMGKHVPEKLQSYIKESTYQSEIYQETEVGGFVGLIEKYVREQIYRPLPKPATMYNYVFTSKGLLTEQVMQLEAAPGRDNILYFQIILLKPDSTFQRGNPETIKERFIEDSGTFGLSPNTEQVRFTRMLARYVASVYYPDQYPEYNFPHRYDYILLNPPGFYEAVTTAIDISSVVLSPVGLDFIPDFTGTVFAVATGHWGDAATYSASFWLPFVGAGAVKAGLFIFAIIRSPQQEIILRVSNAIDNYKLLRRDDGALEVLDLTLRGKIDGLGDLAEVLRKDIQSLGNKGEEFLLDLLDKPELVDSWKRMGNHSNRTKIVILERRLEFDNFDMNFRKSNPYTSKEMFDPETGGYVVCHKQHNVKVGDANSKAEFAVAEALANDGKRVKLLSEKAPDKVKTPDAEIIGEGIFDFKNINAQSDKAISRNVMDYVMSPSQRSNADGLIFNIKDNPAATPQAINQGVKDAIDTAKAAGTLDNLAKKIGIVYKDGQTKIIPIEDFKNLVNGTGF